MPNLTRDILVRDAIDVDVAFVGRFISSLVKAETLAPSALFCMFNYLSLFAYESYARLKILDPSTAGGVSFTPGMLDLLERSRHSLKLFEDTHRGVSGQLDFFADKVAPAHRRAFIDPVRLPFASAWKADLGLTRYEDQLITSTFATTFTLGHPPEKLFLDGTGETLKNISQEYGRYFRHLGAVPDPTAQSFVSAMDVSGIANQDVRSVVQYSNGFNGKMTPTINMLLSTFQGLINTCDQLLGLDTSEASRQTIFKLRYLTVYQVLRSLSILKDEKVRVLTLQSHQYIDGLLADPDAILIVDPAKKPLRNTLMYYGLDTRIDLTGLTRGRPLYGMVEQVFQLDFEEMEQRLAELTGRIAGELNTWATQKV